MAERFESKVGKIENSNENLFNFLADFRNYNKIIPQDKVKNFEATEDTCSFEVDMVGKTSIKIIKRESPKLIKMGASEDEKKEFFFWIQLKESEDNHTYAKLTMEVVLNPMMKMMASKPLKNFLNTTVDHMAKLTDV